MDDLTTSPDQGQENEHSQVRGFPVYGGRYSVRWVVDDPNRKVNVLGIKDSKHIYQIRGDRTDF